MQRRGTVIGTTEEAGFCRVEAEVPLAEMFGYSTDLRSQTQGKAEFTMEFARYLPVSERGDRRNCSRSTPIGARTKSDVSPLPERSLRRCACSRRASMEGSGTATSAS